MKPTPLSARTTSEAGSGVCWTTTLSMKPSVAMVSVHKSVNDRVAELLDAVNVMEYDEYMDGVLLIFHGV
jgi:hypothetical protein